MSQSLAQERAKDAFEKVKSLQGKGDYGKYVSYVKSLPATILMCGLGQALAMEKAGKSNDKGHEYLYDHVSSWLCGRLKMRGDKDILDVIINGDEEQYIFAQGEAMEYLEWLKKFAVAYLDEKKDSNNGEGGE